MPLPAPRGERVAIGLARGLALLAALIGALVLVAWLVEAPGLDRLLPGLHAMAPNAGAGFLAAGIGLFCLTFAALRPVAWFMATSLVLLGTLTVSQDLFNTDLGIDQALVTGAE
jgi:hypothetical protein